MFSVIIPTHNSEKSIEKTLNNILKKLLHTSDEIIVVNDGSTDNTLKTLEKYSYNSQVKIISQPNAGVSAARNTGIRNLSENSKFVTFVDDSDGLSKNFFEEVLSFFNKYNNVEIISTPIKLVKDNKIYEQSLNYRFYTNKKIINILNDFKYIQYHIGGMVFKSKIFNMNLYLFDEQVNYWEDAKFINMLLLDKKKYGLVKNVSYLYDRNENSSLSKVAWNFKSRYAPHIINNYKPLITYSIKRYGEVIKYIQYLILNHYLNYMVEQNEKIINYKFIKGNQLFELETFSLFKYIDIGIINELKVPNSYKWVLYNIKGVEFPYYKYFKKIKCYIHKYSIKDKEMVFSFSHESYGVSEQAEVYTHRRNQIYNKVNIYEKKKLDILGIKVQDFSRTIFSAKVSFIELLTGINLVIKDENLSYPLKIRSSSLFLRVFKKLMKIKK
ncbi:glycosyltransferase family 2 protein [Staphylococcus nepalensis]|uniref:Glycosyl transferase, family 2 n=2 Tax=Staphylococcus nepalensis TaxID=214473 RepID=A0A380GNQ0_9STAP|nr:glycosyltransferase family 2 protein [Staphylococcus nepalensis]GGB87204.1 minor teichoic acid biosynthesis protein GgaA [Staphylococcus nepalensis]SUM56036.1 glycosyl transferase, family 2 [Staphylococcus nepalensis]VDG68012.1 glycosyl transferase family 2 [Lacrimispora indolis]